MYIYECQNNRDASYHNTCFSQCGTLYQMKHEKDAIPQKATQRGQRWFEEDWMGQGCVQIRNKGVPRLVWEYFLYRLYYTTGTLRCRLRVRCVRPPSIGNWTVWIRSGTLGTLAELCFKWLCWIDSIFLLTAHLKPITHDVQDWDAYMVMNTKHDNLIFLNGAQGCSVMNQDSAVLNLWAWGINKHG